MKLLLIVLVAALIACANAFLAPANFGVRAPASGMTMRARNCDLLGKTPNRKARVVTFSHSRIHKVQHLNLQTKKYFSTDLNRIVKLRISTKAIKTIDKYGIDQAAKKFGVNLKNF